MAETISTPITEMFNIKVPVILAGMNVAAGPKLAAAVSNAGGLGVIGGLGYTPKMLRRQIQELKSDLKDPKLPFGIDLLLPQVGGSARKTNSDYTKGQLPELIDIIIEEGTTLFVSAVGIPPKWAVDKLHEAGVYCMNMCGAVKHVDRALSVGVDIVCCQGGEGGGHTGSTPTSILIPKCVDAAKGKLSPLTGRQVPVVAAGGIFDGRGLAMALSLGASAVWVGTRFICAEEAGAPERHQKGVLGANFDDTIRTIIYSGRPMRVLRNPYNEDWEQNKAEEIKSLTAQGIIPVYHDVESAEAAGKPFSLMQRAELQPLLMGECSAAVTEIKPAKDIIDDMVATAVAILKQNAACVAKL